MAEPLQRFEPEELRDLADALVAWAENHPDPHTPVIGFADGSAPATPTDIATAMWNHSRGEPGFLSRSVLRLYLLATSETPLAQMVADLRALANIGRAEGTLTR